MKRNIAIVAGGDTSEIVVSLRSAQGIYSFIDKEKYNLYIVEMEGRRWEVQLPDGNKVPVDRNDFSFTNGTEKVVFDFAYITIHGTPGEDGRLQGYFDMLRIPYSCCGVLAAAITYDKFACNQYLKAFGVRIAESLLLRQGQSVSDEDVIEKIGLPCFIKPSLGGSSFGVTKVKTKEQIQPAIVKAFGEAEEVIVEAFMEGTELTCGCYKTKEKSVVFPPTEVVTHNEFFDYDAKYNGQVDEITPARISPELTGRVQKLTSAIYDILGCSGIAESLLLRQGQSVSDEDVIEKIGLPCFIKPSLGGSSFGVTKVKTKEQIQPAIVKAFGEAEEVIVEAFMEGTELTCGCYKTKEKSVVFPPTEVVTHNEFFDYDAKYNGQVDEITPARISPELTGRVQKLTSAIYDILGCSGIIRVDYIVTAGEKLNLLEVNTTPGMTATSFIPQQVRAAGLDIKDVMTDIIENKF